MGGPAVGCESDAQTAERATVRDFVLAYYRVIGARVEHNRVYVDEELARELDGPWAGAREFAFEFGLDGEEDDPEEHRSELVGPGSMRLDEIIGSVRRRRRMGLGFLELPLPEVARAAPGVGQYWEPVLALGFRLNRLGASAEESLYQTATSMTSGRVYSDFPLETLAVQKLREKPPYQATVARRRLSFRRAYRRACLDVVRYLSEGDAAWANEAIGKMAKEKEHLQAYYRQVLRERGGRRVQSRGRGTGHDQGADRFADEAAAQAELERRLAEETSRFRPRVRVRVYAAAILYALVARGPSPDGNGPGICVFDALEAYGHNRR